MKKALSLLLALALMFAMLVGCGGEDDNTSASTELTKEDLVGKWNIVFEFDAMLDIMEENPDTMGDLMDASEDVDMSAMFESLGGAELGDMRIATEFTADGEMVLKPEAYVDAVMGLLDNYFDWLAEGDNLYDFLADTAGISKAELKASLEQMGMSTAEYIDVIKSQFGSMEDTLYDAITEEDEMEKTYYSLEDGKLYTWTEGGEDSKSSFDINYEGKVINIKSVTDDGETIELPDGAFRFEK